MGDLEREKRYLYWLCSVPQLGAVSVRRIWENLGSAKQAYYIEGTELLEKKIIRKRTQAESFDQSKKSLSRILEEYESLGKRGISFITPWDSSYPVQLKHIYDYPMGLWIKGKLPESGKASVAVVGARSCTSYGAQVAEYIGRELSSAGVQVISGLALGIDGAGQKGALEGPGGTWAVLGCGVNICYPKGNYLLFERIPENGGIISEYPPDTPPLSQNFPVRNRIISGLSDAVLVIEARMKSGSLITAQMALEQGKEVFALPGRITDPLSLGCNELIKDGASPLTGPGDVMEYLGICRDKQMVLFEKNTRGLAKNEKMVYSCLDSAPKHVEEIAGACGLSVCRCFESLLELEMAGLAAKTTGQYYIRRLI